MSYPGGPIDEPNTKYKRFRHMKNGTAATRAARRRTRNKRSGRRTWLHEWPRIRTDKASTRNNGRAPRYSTDPVKR
jgi:hypothetical protein